MTGRSQCSSVMTACPIKSGAPIRKHSSHKSEGCLSVRLPVSSARLKQYRPKTIHPHWHTHTHSYLLCSWGCWVPLSVLSAEWRWVQCDDVIFLRRLPDVLFTVAYEHGLLVNKIDRGSQPKIAKLSQRSVSHTLLLVFVCLGTLCLNLQGCVCVCGLSLINKQ